MKTMALFALIMILSNCGQPRQECIQERDLQRAICQAADASPRSGEAAVALMDLLDEYEQKGIQTRSTQVLKTAEVLSDDELAMLIKNPGDVRVYERGKAVRVEASGANPQVYFIYVNRVILSERLIRIDSANGDAKAMESWIPRYDVRTLMNQRGDIIRTDIHLVN